jgi:eukaryotic-like serine/threonine-protein kinase
VKGTLFVDYVRMLRARKDVDWSRHLRPEDLAYLHERIAPTAWYPMETFERMGLAILAEITSDMQLARAWGRAQIDGLSRTHGNLVAPGDPCDTLMRFRVLRRGFFDFSALDIPSLHDGEAIVLVDYGMSARAEEAASWQTLGFFERLLEVSGARNVLAQFSSTSWTGDLVTTIQLHWKL